MTPHPPPSPLPLGASFWEQYAAAKTAKQAINIDLLKTGFTSRLSIFWPVIVGCVFLFNHPVAVVTARFCYPSGAHPPPLHFRAPPLSHTAFFAAYRGSIENKVGASKTGLAALAQPLAVTALPTLAYAAYTRAVPHQALRMGLYSCVLLHLYDRCIHPKGLMTENMPMARLNRRVW